MGEDILSVQDRVGSLAGSKKVTRDGVVYVNIPLDQLSLHFASYGLEQRANELTRLQFMESYVRTSHKDLDTDVIVRRKSLIADRLNLNR